MTPTISHQIKGPILFTLAYKNFHPRTRHSTLNSMNLQVNLDARAILVIRHVPRHREILGSVTASPLALGARAIAHIPREAAGAAHAEAGGARCGLSDVVREKKRDVLVDVLRDRERSHQPVVAEFRVRNVDSAGAGGDCVVVSVCVQEEEGGAKGGGVYM